jgi:diacylglycerol kinase family enzyme
LGAESEATLTAPSGWVAIVNPRSGGRSRSDELMQRLHDAMSRVLVSERPGHVDELVRSCRDAEGIVVAGGDGTLFEVLQALDRARQKIALVPAGRGNSLARDLDVTPDCDACECITRGKDRSIDLLDVTLQYEDGRSWHGVSASNLAIGYPAGVAAGASRWRRFGAGSYAVAAATTRIQSMDLHVQCDDGPEQPARVTGLIVSNSRYVGPFLGFPSSVPDDGVFHTIEMHAGTVGQVMHNLSSISGLGFYEPGVRKDLRAIAVRLDRPSLLKIDGELHTGVRKMQVRVLPRAVTFRVPAHA